MLSLSERFCWNGTEIAWGVIGEGPPLVLVHGTPFSSFVWRRIAPELARRHRVYFYDLPGYGLSGKHEGQDVSLGVQNKAFAAMLRLWGLEQPDLIAHDFGGATVLRAHFLDGCDYRRLLLFDAVAVRPWGSPFVQHVRNHEIAFAGVPDYIHDAVLDAYIAGAVTRKLDDDERAFYRRPWIGEVGKPAFYRQIAQMDERFTDEIQDRYGELRCPVRLLWGENDEWIPIAQGRELASLLANCSFTPVPGAGHLMQEDRPEAIVAAALRFFESG